MLMPQDKEVRAMASITRTLEQLNPSERERVLNFIKAKFTAPWPTLSGSAPKVGEP